MSDETKDIKIDPDERSFGLQTLTEGKFNKAQSMNSSNISPADALRFLGGNPVQPASPVEPATSTPSTSVDSSNSTAISTDSD
jgi:hypothetical protein